LRFVRYQGLKREQTLAQAMANCDDRMPLPALADALRALNGASPEAKAAAAQRYQAHEAATNAAKKKPRAF